jgi:hypothetical protein
MCLLLGNIRCHTVEGMYHSHCCCCCCSGTAPRPASARPGRLATRSPAPARRQRQHGRQLRQQRPRLLPGARGSSRARHGHSMSPSTCFGRLQGKQRGGLGHRQAWHTGLYSISGSTWPPAGPWQRSHDAARVARAWPLLATDARHLAQLVWRCAAQSQWLSMG